MADRKAKRRLSNLNFSQKKCHVALVDHGAIEHDETLVLKRKTITKKKEDNMSLDEKKVQEEILKAKMAGELKIVELEKKIEADAATAVEVEKAKVESDKKIADLEKSKVESDKKLEDIEKARATAEKAEMVIKAKELKSDDAEVFADVLVKCKDALDADKYELLIKQLEKLQNIADNADILKGKGESNTDGKTLDKDGLIKKRRSELIKDEKLRPSVASKRARLEIEKELKEQG